jgi:hypothetical protein
LENLWKDAEDMPLAKLTAEPKPRTKAPKSVAPKAKRATKPKKKKSS